jgi:hypothetical protein
LNKPTVRIAERKSKQKSECSTQQHVRSKFAFSASKSRKLKLHAETEREKLINGNQKKSHLSKKIQHRCNWGGPYYPQKFQRNSRQKRRKPIIRKANPETDEQQREESKKLTYFCHAARMKIAEKVTRPMKDKNPITITTTTSTTTTVFLSDAVPKLPDPADPAPTSSNRNSILAARESAR